MNHKKHPLNYILDRILFKNEFIESIRFDHVDFGLSRGLSSSWSSLKRRREIVVDVVSSVDLVVACMVVVVVVTSNTGALSVSCSFVGHPSPAFDEEPVPHTPPKQHCFPFSTQRIPQETCPAGHI